jgi:hypothetical protein
MEDKYPRLTEDQISLWLNDPCTQYLLKCLEFKTGDLNDALAHPSNRQADNNLTCQRIDLMQGQKMGIVTASDPVALFHSYDMVEVKDVEAA